MNNLYTLVNAKDKPYEPTAQNDNPVHPRGQVFVAFTNVDDALDVAANALREGVIVGLRKVSDVI